MANAASSQEPLSPGSVVGGFQILDLIGSGAQGQVYSALQVRLRRQVAVKVLAGRASRSADSRARFLQEARLAARMRDPGVVKVIEAGEEMGRLYIVYEFVRGATLRQKLRQQPQLPLDLALQILRDLAVALDAIHEAGILHRDVKPDNIFLSPERGTLLGDLGCARDLDRSSIGTAAGMVVGTPPYLAAELTRGEPASPASDFYALGVTLFECLTGRLPFFDTDIAVLMYRLATQPAPKVSEVSPELGTRFDALLERALAKEPGARFCSGREFVAALPLLPGEFASLPSPRVVAPAGELVKPPRGLPGASAQLERPPSQHTARRPTVPWVVATVTAVGAASVLFFLLKPAAPRFESPPVVAPPALQAEAVPPPSAEGTERARLATLEMAEAVKTGARELTVHASAHPGKWSPALVRQKLVKDWADLLKKLNRFAIEPARPAVPGEESRASEIGMLLVSCAEAYQDVVYHFTDLLHRERERPRPHDPIGLGPLAALDMERDALERAMAVEVTRILSNDSGRETTGEPWLQAGRLVFCCLTRGAVAGTREQRLWRERLQSLARQVWPALTARARRQPEDGRAARAMLKALRYAGEHRLALELVSSSLSAYSALPSGAIDARCEALFAVLEESRLLATTSLEEENAFIHWTRLRDRLLSSLPRLTADALSAAPVVTDSLSGAGELTIRSVLGAARSRLRHMSGSQGSPVPDEPSGLPGAR